MTGFEEPKLGLAIVIPVVLVLLATNTGLGYGYLHYRGIAAEQQTAIARVETANAELQDALSHIHDRMQRSVQQLSLDNRELQGRLAALEQGGARLQRVSPAPLPRTASPTPPSGPPAAAASPSPSAIQGALMGSSNPANFTAPGWVPDYFSNESGVVTGTPKRPQRRSRHPEF